MPLHSPVTTAIEASDVAGEHEKRLTSNACCTTDVGSRLAPTADSDRTSSLGRTCRQQTGGLYGAGREGNYDKGQSCDGVSAPQATRNKRTQLGDGAPAGNSGRQAGREWDGSSKP